MFEKLNRLRTEYEKAKVKFEEAKVKVEETAAKLKAEEATSILGMVEELSFTPEQLAEFLGVADKPKTAVQRSGKTETKPARVAESAGITDLDTLDDEKVDGEDILNEIY